MLKFVIYDDTIKDTKIVDKVIRSTMKELNNKEYLIESYTDYCDKLKNTIKDSNLKVYFLDIEVPNGMSGIDVARKIREYDDNSIIVLMTAHLEHVFEVVGAQISMLCQLDKTKNFEEELKKVILNSIKKINQTKVLTFTTQNITYRVYTDDIYYIKKDPVERKCIITNKYNNAYIYENINDILNKLDDRFMMTNRSCIVNLEMITKVDINKGIMYFKNGDKNDYLSRSKKKELKDRLDKLN